MLCKKEVTKLTTSALRHHLLLSEEGSQSHPEAAMMQSHSMASKKPPWLHSPLEFNTRVLLWCFSLDCVTSYFPVELP